MTLRSTLGLSLGSVRLSLRTQSELAVWGEAQELDSFWISEVRSQDAMVHAMDIAARTRYITVGTAVVPVFTRAAPLLAMAAATVQDLSGGRFVLGVGASSPQVVSGWMGASFERPRTRVQETLQVLRAALTGNAVSAAVGGSQITDFRPGLPAAPVPLLVGATGPAMLRTAGEYADGVIASTFLSAAALPSWLKPFLDARRSSKSRVVAKTFVALADDDDTRARNCRFIGNYLTAPGYWTSLLEQGFEAEAEALRAAGPDRHALGAAVSARLYAQLVCGPDPAAAAQRIEELAVGGATDVVLEPIGDAATPEQTADQLRWVVGAIRQSVGS